MQNVYKKLIYYYFMADQREVILNYVKYHGPVLPVQISKHVNTSILFASAMLSELVSNKNLKISHASIGGSPLYYLSGQEELMDSKLSASLSGREKEIYNLLKSKKVLKENDLEPWQRIAVKSITDFSRLINVKAEDNVENFWKYHLVNDEEAKQIISELMKDTYNKQQQVQEIVSNLKNEELIVQNKIQQAEQGIQTKNENQLETKPQEIRQILTKPEIKFEQKQLAENTKVKREVKKIDSNFYNEVINFMKNNKVEILKEEIVKKNKEFDFVVSINSSFGKLRYLVKAKNKALINDADVSIAFSEGQLKKIPVILLTNGRINKKAALLIEQKMQGQLILKNI